MTPVAAGSYVALTVLGRPPGLPQIPLEEDDEEREDWGDVGQQVPKSPGLPRGDQWSPAELHPPTPPDGVRANPKESESD